MGRMLLCSLSSAAAVGVEAELGADAAVHFPWQRGKRSDEIWQCLLLCCWDAWSLPRGFYTEQGEGDRNNKDLSLEFSNWNQSA